jgi:hypothetical protein
MIVCGGRFIGSVCLSFEGTPMHEYYKDLARKEVLQEYEQAYKKERLMHLKIQSIP